MVQLKKCGCYWENEAHLFMCEQHYNKSIGEIGSLLNQGLPYEIHKRKDYEKVL